MKAVGIALVGIAVICVAIGVLVWSGRIPEPGGVQPPTQNVISLWDNTLIPTGWPASLTATFTPTHTSMVLHVEWALAFKYHYSGDRVSVQTVLYLDGVQIDVKPYSDTLSYRYEQSLTVSAHMPHAVKLSLVIMVQGPGYSTFNETVTGWVRELGA